MSTTHTPHPDVHEHGLADGCDRCQEHAQKPLLSLDDETLGNLIQRIVDDEESRSDNEYVAMTLVRQALNEACGLAKTNPDAFSRYAYGKWGIRIIVSV